MGAFFFPLIAFCSTFVFNLAEQADVKELFLVPCYNFFPRFDSLSLSSSGSSSGSGGVDRGSSHYRFTRLAF